jgi:ABC-type sugar transport system permease subunit
MASAASARPKHTVSRQKHSETLAAYMFLSPYLLVTLIFKVGVIAFAIYVSFTAFNLFTAPEWVGLENYIRTFNNDKFVHSLVNVLWYVVVVVPIQTAVALGLASLLNSKVTGTTFFRTVFYAPSVTSPVVISLIFWWLYLKTGFVNLLFTGVLGMFGIEWATTEWLNNLTGLFQPIARLWRRYSAQL